MRVFSQCSSQLQATIKAFFNNPAPATRSARSMVEELSEKLF